MTPGKPAPSSQWRLIACDLDGTLIGWNHKTNERDLAALRRAREAGFAVAICTGRNPLECGGILGALDLPEPLGLGVFANGALIADMASGKAVHSQFIDAAITAQAVDFFGTLGHAVLLLADDPATRLPVYIMTDHGPPHRATTEWLVYNKVHALTLPDPPDHLRERIVRLGIVVNIREAADLHARLQRQFGPRAATHSIYSPAYDCQIIEFFHPLTNKWSGLEHLAQLTGISPQQIITIGDDINDLHMLQGARLSFAMGNAAPEVQRQASGITLSHAQCGVAHVVDLLLQGKLEIS
jgi:Cof subfamily protein (haloacid dehalogenase superfamily)